MPVLKKAHDVPAVPVSSQVLDQNGKVTQEWAHFLRALTELVNDITDVEVLARENKWRPPVQAEITVDSDILPASDATVNIGSSTLRFNNGYFAGTVEADTGFYAPGTATNAIQAPNGGVLAKDIAATDSAWNGLQNSTGGVAGNAVYLKTNATAPASPGTGYGGLDYQGASVYWYWNGTAWGTLDFSVAGAGQTPWTSDVNAATHNLYNLKTLAINTGIPSASDYLVDARASGALPDSIIHLSIDSTDNGAYFQTYTGARALVLGGATLSSGTWTAKNTSAAGLHIIPGNQFQFFSNTGLTAGTSFTPTALLILTSTGNLGIGVNPSYQLHLATDSAGKPTTSTWTIASDIRLKRNVRRFEGDIEVIRKLDPIVAEYNGKGGTPEGQRVVSFDAEKLRGILPQAVSSTRGKLHPGDPEETDMLGVNIHEILIHMLRAVQQIDGRLQKLESHHEPVRDFLSSLGFGKHK